MLQSLESVLKQKPDDCDYSVNEISTIVWRQDIKNPTQLCDWVECLVCGKSSNDYLLTKNANWSPRSSFTRNLKLCRTSSGYSARREEKADRVAVVVSTFREYKVSGT